MRAISDFRIQLHAAIHGPRMHDDRAGLQHLQGDQAPQRELARQVDHSHAARADAADHLVSPRGERALEHSRQIVHDVGSPRSGE